MSIEQIAAEALALPTESRALLADRLVESLDPADDPAIAQIWTAEAIRRREDVRRGRVQPVSAEEALARVRSAAGRSDMHFIPRRLRNTRTRPDITLHEARVWQIDLSNA